MDNKKEEKLVHAACVHHTLWWTEAKLAIVFTYFFLFFLFSSFFSSSLLVYSESNAVHNILYYDTALSTVGLKSQKLLSSLIYCNYKTIPCQKVSTIFHSNCDMFKVEHSTLKFPSLNFRHN